MERRSWIGCCGARTGGDDGREGVEPLRFRRWIDPPSRPLLLSDSSALRLPATGSWFVCFVPQPGPHQDLRLSRRVSQAADADAAAATRRGYPRLEGRKGSCSSRVAKVVLRRRRRSRLVCVCPRCRKRWLSFFRRCSDGRQGFLLVLLGAIKGMLFSFHQTRCRFLVLQQVELRRCTVRIHGRCCVRYFASPAAMRVGQGEATWLETAWPVTAFLSQWLDASAFLKLLVDLSFASRCPRFCATSV